MTDYCAFQVGQHVACVDNDWPMEKVRLYEVVYRARAILPEKGRVYTVRSVGPSMTGSAVILRLREISNKRVSYNGKLHEIGFEARHFRPLQKLTPEMFLTADAPVDEKVTS